MRQSISRQQWLILALLSGLLLTGANWFVTRPTYMDAQYYFVGGLRLAQGAGMSDPYTWNYFSGLETIEQPSHLYWMPLVSWVIAPFLLLDPSNSWLSFRLAQIPLLFITTALTLLAGYVALVYGGNLRHLHGAVFLTLFAPYYFNFWGTTDGFSLFALLGAGSFILVYRGQLSRDKRWFLAAGVAAGLAHLTRADGVLLWLVMAVWYGWVNRKENPLPQLGWLLLGYLLVMTPWFGRNWLEVGTFLAPNSHKTIFLVEYNDLFNGRIEQISWSNYWNSGLNHIVQTKMQAFSFNFQNLIASQTWLVGLPFILWGAWHKRAHPLTQLILLYSLGLFLAMTLVFTFPGMRGSYFHSSTVALPFWASFLLIGLDQAIEWLVQRRPHLQAPQAQQVFTVALCGLACLVSVTMFAQSQAAGRQQFTYQPIGDWLAQHCTQACEAVVVTNPPQLFLETGLSSIAFLNNSPEESWEIMDKFGVWWVILEPDHTKPWQEVYKSPFAHPLFVVQAQFDDNGQPVYLLQRQNRPLP